MARDELTRRAGAGREQGVPLTEEDVLGSDKPQSNKDRASKKPLQPEEIEKILRPEVLEFRIQRKGADCKLVVPTVFTIGDVAQRKVWEDFDAYYRLVMIEFGKVSGIDPSFSSPAIAFADDNIRYLSIAITTSNCIDFMDRVLSKSAYVLMDVDGEEKRVRVAYEDIAQLNTASRITIGGNYVARWISNAIEARNAKNPQRAAQT